MIEDVRVRSYIFFTFDRLVKSVELIPFIVTRKSKYSAETVALIVDAIRKTGSDSQGYKTAGIHKDTFYSWMKEKPDFSDKVASAKEHYRVSCAEGIKEQAQRAFLDYLYGRVVQQWSGEEITEVYDSEGNLKSTIKKRYDKSANPGPAVWAIERVLGKTPLLDALQTMITEGIAPPVHAKILSDGLAKIAEDLRAEHASRIEEVSITDGEV